MPQDLTDLDLSEIAIVDRGANRSDGVGHAKIALYKRDEITKGVKYLVSGEDNGNHLPYTGEDGKPDHRLMGAAWAALHGGYRGNTYSGPDKEAALAHLKHIYEQEGMDTPAEKTEKGESMTLEQIEQRVTQIEKTEADNAELKKALEARATEADVVLKMSDKECKIFGKMTAEKRKEFLAADEEKRKAMMKAHEEPDGDECEKREQMETQKLEEAAVVAKSAQERVEKAEAELAAIKKAQRLAHFDQICKSELSHMSSNVVKGEDLMAAADAFGGEETDAYKRHFGMLKAADAAQAEKFSAIGKWGNQAPTATALIDAATTEIMKRDRVSKDVAAGRAILENPQLYQQYEQERAGRA